VAVPGGVAETVTVADCDAEPPVPVQVSVNFVVAARAEVVCEPPVGSDPLQPPEAMHDVAPVDDQVEPLVALPPDHAPEAVQEAALAVDHVNVELLPPATVLGFAAIVTVGAGEVTVTIADCVALPLAPVHVSP
jgi:hypothetical protein